MDGLPGHLLDKVLFGIDLRSLAIMRCTNRSLKSHIYDPYFESEYFSRIGSGLLHISRYCSFSVPCYHPHHGDSRSLRFEYNLKECHVLGSCYGLLLLFIDDLLCVANPLTKKFRFLNHSSAMSCAWVMNRPEVFLQDKTKHIGFAVNQIDRTTQSFKIVHMMVEGVKSGKRMYWFEINAGNSWRRSKTKITCPPSLLDSRMKKPVYFDGTLHWLREDGSIVAFNPETEKARLIPIKFPQGLSRNTLFAAGGISLTLISATEEAIHVYALENILSDPKWVLVTQIRNGVLDEKRLDYCKVEAYDGKCLVLREREYRKKKEVVSSHLGHSSGLWGLVGCVASPRLLHINQKNKKQKEVVHVYDLRTNKWVVMGSVLVWFDANPDIFQFTPSLSFVVGLDEIILPCDDDKRISSLSSIMGLVGGISSEKVQKQLRKRSVEAEEKKLMLLKKKKMKPSSRLLYEQRANKKRRV